MRAISFATLLVACVFGGCLPGAESGNRDKIKEAEKGCARKDASLCFYAGTVLAEGAGANGPNQEAVRFWVKGCALKHAESCDALATSKGAIREAALVEACNAGDLVSCNRRSGEFPQDEKGQGEARALRQTICKTSAGINAQTSGRDLRGTAEACASLARMVAAGQGGGKDEIAALKLELLATTLRSEALFRHEHELDGKPAPAVAPPEPAVLGRRGMKKPEADPAIQQDKERQHREYELSKGALEAWLAGVQTSMAAVQKGERMALAKDPSLPAWNPVEKAMSGGTGGSAVDAKCAACVDGCGGLDRCAADDFAGGRCSHLKCPAGTSCPQFDGCVGECTAKADACAKGCGDCGGGARGK